MAVEEGFSLARGAVVLFFRAQRGFDVYIAPSGGRCVAEGVDFYSRRLVGMVFSAVRPVVWFLAKAESMSYDSSHQLFIPLGI